MTARLDFKRVTTQLDDLLAVPFRPPADAGALWWGCPHHDLATAVKSLLLVRKWAVEDSLFALSPDGADAAIVYSCRPPLSLPRPITGDCYLLGVLASNARRRSLRAYLGVTDVQHSCGVWLDRILLGGRHRRMLQGGVERVAGQCVGWFGGRARRANGQVQGLRAKTPDQHQTINLLFEAGRRKLLPWSRVGLCDGELRGQPPRNAWELLGAVAYTARLNPPLEAVEQVYQFRLLLEGLR